MPPQKKVGLFFIILLTQCQVTKQSLHHFYLKLIFMLKLQSKLSMPLQSNAIKCNTRKSLKIFQDFNKRKSPSVLLLQSKLGNSFLNYAQQSLKLALVPIQPPIYPSSHQKLNFSFQMVISNSPSPLHHLNLCPNNLFGF